MVATVAAVSRSATHTFSKPNEPMIRLVAGLGVAGDAHMGEKVKHRFHIRTKGPDAPNLRQVHLIHQELFDELRVGGFNLQPGAIGENVTTRGLNLLALPRGTKLRLGSDAIIEVTGLRNPCRQIEGFQTGLLPAVLGRDSEGNLIRKAGIMAVVVASGAVEAGDMIGVMLPVGEPWPLLPV